MDPDTCMDELQELLEKYKQQRDRLNNDDTQDLVIHIEALDSWISCGGFLPHRWKLRAPDPAEIAAAKKEIEDGLAEFNDENPEFPGKRSIEGFYEAVRTLKNAGRIT